MSGFAALFDRARGGAEREQLHAMLDSIDHRGPDGRGAWIDTNVALGHQQLESTPEARFDDQPVQEGDLVITADARIDNRDDLIEALSISTPPSRTPDSKLILAAYREWGVECVPRLIGSFAFVISDASDGSIFCARDRFGVKPFCYYRDKSTFAAASEKKALLTLPFVSEIPNNTKIGDLLTKTFEDKEATFFESICRLPPAHAAVFRFDDSRMWQYWDLDPSRTITLGSDAAYERRFRELFEQAVRCRLRSPDPVGTALSGGLDSSSITVVAREQLPASEPLHTFSNVYDDVPSADEREYVETIIGRDSIDSHYIFCDDVCSLPDSETLFNYFDQPPHNMMHFSRWELTKRADDAGVGVVLGGALGDTAVGYGLSFLPQLFLTGRWLTLKREIRSLSDLVDAPPAHMFKRHVLSNVIPEPIRRLRRRAKGESLLLERVNPLLSPDFVDRNDLRRRYKRLHTQRLGISWSDRRDQRDALLGARVPATLETSDLTNAAFGIERRYPFTDARLVEFCLAIPPEQKLSNGWTRSIVRRALGDLLPEKIQWRPWKTEVTEAFYNALSLSEQDFESLFTEPGSVRKYVDLDVVQRCYGEFRESPQYYDARALWTTLSLWAWLDRYGCSD